MLKLKRYLLPYVKLLLLGMLLLFGQASLELSLPNLMSNIVNVGIQNGGIEESAPKVILEGDLELLKQFMTPQEQERVEESYLPLSESGQEQTVQKQFPKAGEGVLVFSAPEAQEELDAVFGRADYALTQYLLAQSTQSGRQATASSQNEASLDLSVLRGVAAEGILEQERQEMIRLAADTPETMIGNVAAVLNRAIYQDLGADLFAMETGYILRTGLWMLLLCLVGVGCAVGAGFCFARLGAGVARDLRRDIFKKVSGFTNSEMDHFSTASLITRTTNDVTQVQMLLTMGVRMLCFAPIMGIGGIIMALQKSSGMAWIIAVAVLVILGTIAIIFSIAMPRFNRMQKLVDRLNLVARENLSGIMVIRAFRTQKFEEERFDRANRDLAENTLFVNRTIISLMPMMMLVMNLVTLFVVWMGAEQIAQSAMQVGDMMAFIQYAMQIIMSFLIISMIFIMLPRASVSAGRIHEVLVSVPSVQDPKHPRTLEGRAKGEIEFCDVSFKYEGADEYVLRHISFKASPGKTTAFIGATGSGKSTLVNLVPRFYDVTEGKITLDGVDIRELSQHELRQNIGYVPQKGMLFTGDIASNLRYGDPKADDALVHRAAEIAQAQEFIEKLEGGYTAAISQGGTNVSGGQRQRLSIARALVRRAPVYIFDDSFSALDFATDLKLRRALAPYTKDSAVLLVAQRVSTIMHADQIIVLDEGRMVGIGTHEELLRSCETYRDIAESQLSKEELA